jgi:hypothetical protein
VLSGCCIHTCRRTVVHDSAFQPNVNLDPLAVRVMARSRAVQLMTTETVRVLLYSPHQPERRFAMALVRRNINSTLLS